MKLQLTFILLLILVSCGQKNDHSEDRGAEINWQSFNQGSFEIAQQENKLVLLEIGANWCHWCHVMDDSTYSDKEVQDYLSENFVLCREDQDERPDLFTAYRAWGWPAIIIFNENGEELLKLKGYQPRLSFLDQLKAIRKNPIVLEASDELIHEKPSRDIVTLEKLFYKKMDFEKGGYNRRNKSLQFNGVLHALKYYDENDSLKNWLDLTVENSFQLIDPVWGGAYQYSSKYSWNNQHFEKLLRVQTGYIKAYALYGKITGNMEAIEKAEGILNYCDRFLNTETPLYCTSQNADLVSGVHSADYYKLNESERLEQGVPSVDEHVYLKENAEMALALTYLWAATDKAEYLERGQAILDYLLDNFSAGNGLYVHEMKSDKIIPFEDNRQLVDALLRFYMITGEIPYLQEARNLSNALIKTFNTPEGLVSVTGDLTIAPAIVPLNNLDAVLTFQTLHHFTGEAHYEQFANETFDKLTENQLTRSTFALPQLIKVKEELKKEPFHALLIGDGSKSDIRKQYLQSILLDKNQFLIFEELHPDRMTEEEELFYGDYPPGTLFMCTSSFCSAPISDMEGLNQFLDSQN